MTYEYNMKIEAKTETEADEKMKALTILASKLNAKELAKLAQVVKHDPVKTALAKKYLGL
ncbi:MAG: hypothetical protein JST82_11265 [Bacteroidetes bacterium]|nr:hypothetical protein [Bacteroidota bacterium]